MFRRCRGSILVALIGLLVIAGVVVARMFVIHDQDVTVYSVRPDGRVQVIGLRHRTYLLDYGGQHDLVLFSTTIGTGVLTHGPEPDQDQKAGEIPGEIAGVRPVGRE